MAYQGNVPTHFGAKLMGFLLLPAAGALATRLAAPLVDAGLRAAVKDPAKQPSPQSVMATVGALAHAGVAYAAYNYSEASHPVGSQAFARGGMWGSGLSAAFLASSPFFYEGSPMPAVSGTKSPLMGKAIGLLTAQAAGAVAAKRVATALARR